jgi:hypothetical protein
MHPGRKGFSGSWLPGTESSALGWADLTAIPLIVILSAPPNGWDQAD